MTRWTSLIGAGLLAGGAIVSSASAQTVPSPSPAPAVESQAAAPAQKAAQKAAQEALKSGSIEALSKELASLASSQTAAELAMTSGSLESLSANLASLASSQKVTELAMKSGSLEAVSAELASLASSRVLAQLGSLASLGSFAELGQLSGQQSSQAAREAAREAAQAARELTTEKALQGVRYDRGRSLYTAGTTAMDRAEWAKALELFSQIVEQKGDRADAALYWKAYCQNKLGQRTEASGSIQDLVKAYPNSRWLSDAKALDVEVRGASGRPVRPDAETDDELKLLALNSLMATDSELVLPALQKMLQSQQPLKMKRKALFVLSQSTSPKAREIVVSVAKGSANPDMQAEAIRYLGISHSKENSQVLADIYAATADKEVKRRILEAYMMAGERERVYVVARGEGDVQLRRSAITQLGAMQANEQLWKMYQAEKDVDLKRDLIRAMYVSNDAEHITQLAKTEADPTLRREAIRGLGILHADKTGALLSEIYASAGSNIDIRREVINGLFIQGNAKALVDIARKETDPQLKKELVSRLATMKSKEATDYLMELINK
jgi:tetratricopeptide (TPR) repeat protein